MNEKIIILDFGSQTTQLLGRRIRELNTFCEIVPFNKFPYEDETIKGVVLSGSPFSVHDKDSFKASLDNIRKKYPILAIGYGAQFIAQLDGGVIEESKERELGVELISSIEFKDELFNDIPEEFGALLSISDKLETLPKSFKTIARSNEGNTVAYKVEGEQTWGLQFHPESPNTENGEEIISSFLDICKCERDWNPKSFVESTVRTLQEELGDDKVILALSGGVDSSVVAVLLNKAIGKNLTCIFVDHGLLRKNEFEKVLEDYEHLGLNVIGIDAKDRFYKELAGVKEPEQKRKIIGRGFIDVFDEEAGKLKDIKWLAQGTIYPDIIESLSVTGVTIKSHHNVGGLPEKMNLKLCEPLKLLFKDEVRKIGAELGMQPHLIKRHPFPGPGLGVRILGDITPDKVRILQDADDIYVSLLREHGLYDTVWQAGAILLPVQSVGVMDDERTYENAVALRAVTSVDALTADWSRLPFDFLAKVSNEIILNVKGVNRVVYDISSKPPATIEWE